MVWLAVRPGRLGTDPALRLLDVGLRPRDEPDR
jgi:hypothetical protein